MQETTKTLDPSEAPEGYYAVLKSSLPRTREGQPIGNICARCDWRPECQKRDTDFSKPNHRCMADSVIHTATGKEVKRKDGCSVVFKKEQG